MTMHLVRGMSTVNTSKRKKRKLTLQQIAKYETDMRAYNKRMRQIHCHDLQMNIEEYIAYCHGEHNPRKKDTRDKFQPLKSTDTYKRTTPNIPSANSIAGVAAKKAPQEYTGDYIKGIACMHKSNLVPITDKKQAIEVSQMRRN